MNLKKASTSIVLSALLFSGCATTSSHQTAEIKTQIAVEYIKIGNIDSAKNALDEALTRNPNHAMANMMLGVTYQLVGTKESFEKADKYFKSAVQSDPNNAQIRNNYGQYLFVAEKYEEAIVQFKHASNTIGYSGRDVALNNLGQCYLKLNQLKEAESNFIRALNINKRNLEALTGLAETHYQNKNGDLANEVFNDYVLIVGHDNLDAKALWLGIRIDRLNNNSVSMKQYIEALSENFPRSAEYKKYLEQKNKSEFWL